MGRGRYIEYETQVDKLRQFRKKTQGEDAVHGVADTAGVRRLHFIYARALRKFKGDLRLWHSYLAFCTRPHRLPHRRRLRALGQHATCVRRESPPPPTTISTVLGLLTATRAPAIIAQARPRARRSGWTAR